MRSARSCGFFKPANTILVPAWPHTHSRLSSHSNCTPVSDNTSFQENACTKPFTAHSQHVVACRRRLRTRCCMKKAQDQGAAAAEPLRMEDWRQCTPGMYFFGACATRTGASAAMQKGPRKLYDNSVSLAAAKQQRGLCELDDQTTKLHQHDDCCSDTCAKAALHRSNMIQVPSPITLYSTTSQCIKHTQSSKAQQRPAAGAPRGNHTAWSPPNAPPSPCWPLSTRSPPSSPTAGQIGRPGLGPAPTQGESGASTTEKRLPMQDRCAVLRAPNCQGSRPLHVCCPAPAQRPSVQVRVMKAPPHAALKRSAALRVP